MSVRRVLCDGSFVGVSLDFSYFLTFGYIDRICTVLPCGALSHVRPVVFHRQIFGCILRDTDNVAGNKEREKPMKGSMSGGGRADGRTHKIKRFLRGWPKFTGKSRGQSGWGHGFFHMIFHVHYLCLMILMTSLRTNLEYS